MITLYDKEEPWEDTQVSLTKVLAGKTVKAVLANNESSNIEFTFEFEDGTRMFLETEWVYELKVTKV